MEPAFLPAAELAARIRRRELGARELLESYLARIERFSELNAVVTLDAERALRLADEADAGSARSDSRRPLHGLPITIKDQFETEGLRTTCGAAVWAEHVPERDAVPVARLRAAGAIVFGKSNVPPLCADWQTDNELFGVTRNPWNLERTPGGSSGGAAAAVAAGLTALELGGDIGGSIRIPAAWCGIYGHKPSYGLVPKRGTLPSPPGTLTEGDVAVCGPLARSAEDLGLALGILAGPDERHAVAWGLRLPPPRECRRVAVWCDDEAFPVAAEVRAAVEAAAAELGAEPARPDVDLAEVVRLRHQLTDAVSSVAATNAELELARGLDPADDSRRAREVRFRAQPHRDWLHANERRARLRAVFDDFFRDFDALLVPPAPVAAIPHGGSERIVVDGVEQPYWHLGAWISLAGAACLPSSVAPVGRTAQGLPLGVEIVGPYLEDRTTIELARRLGPFEPPPGYS